MAVVACRTRNHEVKGRQPRRQQEVVVAVARPCKQPDQERRERVRKTMKQAAGGMVNRQRDNPQRKVAGIEFMVRGAVRREKVESAEERQCSRRQNPTGRKGRKCVLLREVCAGGAAGKGGEKTVRPPRSRRVAR